MFKMLRPRYKNVFIRLYQITSMCEGDIHGHAYNITSEHP